MKRVKIVYCVPCSHCVDGWVVVGLVQDYAVKGRCEVCGGTGYEELEWIYDQVVSIEELE